MTLFLQWLLYAFAIGITSYALPGVSVDSLFTVLIVAVLLGAINAFVRPVLIFLTLPITIITLGLFILVINALLIMLVGYAVSGFVVEGFLWAVVFSIVLSLVSAFLQLFVRSESSR